MKSRYITPDNAPSGNFFCRRVLIPDDVQYLALFMGTLLSLTYENNWEQVTGISPADSALAFQQVFDSIEFSADRTCRVIGEIILWSATISPNSNWLICDGTSLLRSDYPDLFAVVGSTYGSVDGTHFNLPDFRGYIPIGQDGSSYIIGTALGEANHVLTTPEIPSHSHTDTGHTHLESTAIAAIGAAITGVPVPSAIPGTGFTGSGNSVLTSTGGGGAHNNIQPSLPVTYLIVAK